MLKSENEFVLRFDAAEQVVRLYCCFPRDWRRAEQKGHQPVHRHFAEGREVARGVSHPAGPLSLRVPGRRSAPPGVPHLALEAENPSETEGGFGTACKTEGEIGGWGSNVHDMSVIVADSPDRRGPSAPPGSATPESHHGRLPRRRTGRIRPNADGVSDSPRIQCPHPSQLPHTPPKGPSS